MGLFVTGTNCDLVSFQLAQLLQWQYSEKRKFENVAILENSSKKS
jgi:hypothetical protein